MESPMTSLDLRTLLRLLTDDRLPHDKVLALIADECDISVDQLTETFVVHPTPAPSTEPVKAVRQHHRPNRTYSRWDEARVNELIERWNRDERPSTIAQAMGCSTQTVYQKISKLRKQREDIKSRESKNPAFASLSS